MDGILNLFQPIVNDKWNDKLVRQYLGACQSHQAFSKKSVSSLHSVIGTINSFLNTPSARLHGFLLLQTFVPQCSTGVFEEHGISWMQQCVKGMQERNEAFSVAAEILVQLLETSSQFPEFTKKVATTIIPQAVVLLARGSNQGLQAALRCLATCMEKYRGPCGQCKNQIEKMLLLLLDREEPAIISLVADCFALLPQIGGGGNRGDSYKTEWKLCTENFLGSLHETLNRLYEDLNLLQTCEGVETRLPLPDVTGKSSVERLIQLQIRFVNLCSCLEALLRNPFPVAKTVPVGALFDVICSSLDVNCKTLGSRLMEALTVGAVLPEIHIATLRLLDSLIVCCETTLYPQALLINKLVLSTLKWSSPESRSYGVSQPYEALRCTAYRVLQSWLQVARAGSLVEMFAKDLVVEAISDCKPQKETVKLQLNAKMPQSKKKRKLNLGLVQEDRSIHKKINYLANEEVCCEALKTLQWLLHAAGASIKATIHKELQEVVLAVLLELQQGPEPLPIPYSSILCRKEVYQLLLALVLNPNPKWPAPLHMAVNVFSRGLQDPAMEVANSCTLAMAVTEKMIHPMVPSMHFALTLQDLEEVKNEAKENKKNKTINVDEDREDEDDEGPSDVIIVGQKRKGEEKQNEERKLQKVIENGLQETADVVDDVPVPPASNSPALNVPETQQRETITLEEEEVVVEETEERKEEEKEESSTEVPEHPEVISIVSSGDESQSSIQEEAQRETSVIRSIREETKVNGATKRKLPDLEEEELGGKRKVVQDTAEASEPSVEDMLASFVDVEPHDIS